MHTVKEIGERLNVSTGLVYKLIRQGSLRAHRINATFRISEEQLQAYLDEVSRPTDEPLIPFTTKHL